MIAYVHDFVFDLLDIDVTLSGGVNDNVQKFYPATSIVWGICIIVGYI